MRRSWLSEALRDDKQQRKVASGTVNQLQGGTWYGHPDKPDRVGSVGGRCSFSEQQWTHRDRWNLAVH